MRALGSHIQPHIHDGRCTVDFFSLGANFRNSGDMNHDCTCSKPWTLALQSSCEVPSRATMVQSSVFCFPRMPLHTCYAEHRPSALVLTLLYDSISFPQQTNLTSMLTLSSLIGNTINSGLGFSLFLVVVSARNHRTGTCSNRTPSRQKAGITRRRQAVLRPEADTNNTAMVISGQLWEFQGLVCTKSLFYCIRSR
jgi:hypothetical protein